MEVDEHLFNFLTQANLLENSQSSPKPPYTIHELDLHIFEIGLGVVPLINQLLNSMKQSTRDRFGVPDFSALRNSNTASSRLFNWNLIIKALQSLEIPIDSDMKALIVAGDKQVVIEVIKMIYKATLKNNNGSPRAKPKQPKFTPDGALLLDNIDINIDLSESETCLEMLVISLCKCLQVKPKQAAGLLTQNGKFLVQVIMKGLKGKFELILEWYQSILNNLVHLKKLIQKEFDQGALNLVLTALKPGLASKNRETMEKCIELFIEIKRGWYEDEIFQWFMKSDALSYIIKSMNENSVGNFLDFLIDYGRKELRKMFGESFKQSAGDSIGFFDAILLISPLISSNIKLNQLFMNQDIYTYWIYEGLMEAEKNPKQIFPLNFLTELWKSLPNSYQINEDCSNLILNALKSGNRDNCSIIKISSFLNLFRLLSAFSAVKNSYAPIIYKSLTFSLVENYSNQTIREFLYVSFAKLIEDDQKIPLSILLDPLIKQLQVADELYNISDFDFFVSIVRHPKLEIEHAILLIDFLGKVYYNDPIYTKAAQVPFILLAGRYIEFKPMEQYIIKFANFGLKSVIKLFKAKKNKKSQQENETKCLHIRNITLSLIEKLIALRCWDLNTQLKDQLLHANSELKKISGENFNGILIILALLGDPTEMINKYEADSDSLPNSEPKAGSFKSATSEQNNKHAIASLTTVPNGRVQNDLEKIKQKRMERELLQISQTERKKAIEEKTKKALKIQIEKRRIQLGIESKSAENTLVIKSHTPVNDQISLVELENETPNEQELLNVVFKKYLRVANLLYDKYSTSGHKKDMGPSGTFESLKETKSSITEGELAKLLREQGVTQSMISVVEMKKIYNLIIQKMKIPVLNYEGYFNFIFQIAVYIYSRPPIELTTYPYAVSVQALFEHFSKRAVDNGIPLHLYQEPDYGAGDRDVAKSITELLKYDFNIEMPEGYQKVKAKALNVSYKIPSHLGLWSHQKIALEILDDIFFDTIGIHFLEHNISVKNVYHAKGSLTKPEVETSPTFGVPSNKGKYKIKPLPAYLKLTPGIKVEVTRLRGTFPNDILLECSKTLDDLIYSVENDSDTIISRNPKPAGSIINRFIEQKLNEEIQQRAEEERLERKRFLRRQSLEYKLKEIKLEKEEKMREDEEIRRIEEERERRQMMVRANTLKKMKEINEPKIQEFKKRKQEEEERKLAEAEEEKKKMEEKKKKDREMFLKMTLKIREQSPKRIEEKKEEVATKEELNKKRSKSSREKNSKSFESTLRSKSRGKNKKNEIIIDENEKMKLEQEVKQYIGSAMMDRWVNEVLTEYNNSIVAAYEFYAKTFPDSANSKSLSLVGFHKFCSQFNISPYFMGNEDATKIFRILTRNKILTPESPLSLTLYEFKEALVRIAMLSKKLLALDKGKELWSYADQVRALMEWICIPKEIGAASDFLQKLHSKKFPSNPQHRKKLRNNLAKAISMGMN
ncbi:unnamed protein product [Blepharisma stoltei]|uniref:Calponin-homology (CH) domain-containing protein n=1 Tax=Blepharisma stoltei TaxID=1481888 RepID=A0AAU9IBU0_9CILI|nr:unnamed protein product [Blepharisma stoltei]